MTPCGFVSCECFSIACSAAILFVLHLFDDQDISPMCEGHVPPFTLRFGDFKRLRHQPKGVPEPPNILLVVDFSNYVSADEFGDPDFDEDLMLNQIQLMSLHSQENLLTSTVEDLKLAAQQWLWNPLGLELSTSQFVLVLDLNASLDPHWHGRKMVLHFCDTWKEALTMWQIPESVHTLNFELWHKFDLPFRPPRPLNDRESNDLRPPALRLRELQTQERLRHNFEHSL